MYLSIVRLYERDDDDGNADDANDNIFIFITFGCRRDLCMPCVQLNGCCCYPFYKTVNILFSHEMRLYTQ